MTDTTTTTDALVTPGTLTLVTISADYFRADYRAWHNGPLLSEADDIGRTFYAAPSSDSSMVLVVEPRSSDRANGMWSLGRDEAGVRLEDAHGGWNVPRSVVSPYRPTSATSATSDPRPLAVGDRVRVTDEHPNVNWRGETGDVVTADDSRFIGVRMVTGIHVGAVGSFDSRYLERFTPDEGSSSSDRTYSQEEVDALLAKERQEAADALERFKEHANGIAVQYAKDNELCGNFERCMADIGLMGREEWDEAHKVTRYVTFRVEVQATPGEDTYTTRYEAAEFLADRYASSIVDYATEVQDEDGDTLWDA